MNHIELHKILSEDLEKLREGKLKPQQAREIFNGAGKLLSNCKNELIAISMGMPVDVPLLGIKQIDITPIDNGHKKVDFKKKKSIKP